jgi:hypothetical protein
MEDGVSLSRYKAFEIATASNDTGEPLESDVTDTLTADIKSELEARGYKVAETSAEPEDVLRIEAHLLDYKPGSAFARWLAPGAGKTQIIVRTFLIDKKTGEQIGEFISDEAVTEGGLFTLGADVYTLKSIAKGIADQIDQQMKGK